MREPFEINTPLVFCHLFLQHHQNDHHYNSGKALAFIQHCSSVFADCALLYYKYQKRPVFCSTCTWNMYQKNLFPSVLGPPNNWKSSIFLHDRQGAPQAQP